MRGPARHAGLTWFGIVAPAGIPRDILVRLHAEVAAVLGNAQWRERYMPADSYEVSGIGPDEFARLLEKTRADGKAIADLLRAGGYRPN